MSIVNHKITLDVHKRDTQAFIQASQGDTNRCIYASLIENGKPYNVSPNDSYAYTPYLTAVLPNGERLYENCYIDTVANAIVYSFSSQITAVSGEVKCQFELTVMPSGRILYAPSFSIVVEDNLFKDIETEGVLETLFPTDNESINYYCVPKAEINDLAQNINEISGYGSQMTITQMPAILSSAKTSLKKFFEGNLDIFYNEYIEKLGTGKFYNNNNIFLIELPNVASVDTYAIYSCDTLMSVKLPKAKIINGYALASNVNLATVDLKSVTYLGEFALNLAKKIAQLDLPLLEETGTSAMRELSALKTINVPALKKLGTYGLRDCSLLEEITLPSITSLGTQAFNGCTSLKRIIITNEIGVCITSANLFSGTVSDMVNTYPNFEGIYVPVALVDDYKSATNWVNYADYIKPISELEGAE